MSKHPMKSERIKLSETENKIIQIFLDKYILVRLTVKFLKAVCKPLIAFIDYFEARKVRVQDQYQKCVQLLTQHLSLFLKDGGLNDTSDITVTEQRLTAKYTDKEKWLSKRNVFVGSDVKDFLEEINLKPDSPELKDFYSRVYRFYVETSRNMIEFFKPRSRSRIIEYLSVLSPASKELPLKESREKWAYLANKFYNVVTSAEKDDLHRELASYRSLPINPGEDEEVDAWFAKMLTVKTGNTPIFPVLEGIWLISSHNV